MALDDFLNEQDKLGNNYNKFIKLKQEFQDKGFPENIAAYKATNYLTPEKLEKINLKIFNNNDNTAITFFFKNEEELKLIMKYFKVSLVNMQIGDSNLLIELLKLLENE